MDESEQITPADSANSGTPADSGTQTDPEDSKESVIKKVYRKRKESAVKKEQQRQNLLVEAVVLLCVIALWQTVSKTGVFKSKSSSLSYETQASVVSVMDCEFRGTSEQVAEIGEAANAKYAVLITYFAGNQQVRKYLYFKEEPKYRKGDGLTVRVSVFDKDDISIVR